VTCTFNLYVKFEVFAVANYDHKDFRCDVQVEC